MQRLKFSNTNLAGLKLVERLQLEDDRGSFSRLFCATELKAVDWKGSVEQVNLACTTKKGTLRGMHFQYPPHAEFKLVSCIRGEVLDVAVDIRKGSATFLQHYSTNLSSNNKRALLIPAGFAHGFQALTDDVQLIYCHSSAYVQQAEGILNPLDSALKITWPLVISEISEKDRQHPMLSTEFKGVQV